MPTSQILKRSLMAIVACLSLAGAGSAMAAIDIFLKVDGIQGESVDKAHRDEIEVQSWSWGVAAREGAKAGKRGCVQDITLTKFIDRATPPLVAAAALGTQIPKAVLTVRKPGTVPLEFLKLDLSQVLVSSVQQAVAAGQDRFIEEVTLKAASILVSYRPQNADGTLGTAITASVTGGC